MELQTQNSLLSIISEERSHTTSVETLNNELDEAAELREHPSYYNSPASPESPWTCSPLQTPSPSVLYSCIASLRRHDGTIHSVTASPGGLVFAASESRRVRAWRAPHFSDRAVLEARCGGVRSVLAHPGGTLFTSHRDNTVRVWSFDEGLSSFRRVTSLPRRHRLSSLFRVWSSGSGGGRCRVTCMAYHHAGGVLYTGSSDRTVSAWRVSDGRRVDTFAAHEGGVTGMAVSQDDGTDGPCLFTGSSDGSVRIWRRTYREDYSHTLTMILRCSHGHDSGVNAVALSTAAAFLYAGSADGTVSFWEREGGSSRHRFRHGGFLQGHRFAVECVVAVEKMVFTGSEDTTVRIWRREEGSCIHECMAVLDSHRGPVRSLAATLEVSGGPYVLGFLLYTASLDQTLKVWRIKVLPEDDDHDDPNLASVASPVLSPSWVERKRQPTTYFS